MNWYKIAQSVMVWLDDERPMPSPFNFYAKTATQAIQALQQGNVTAISLDHDLGDPSNGTGYDVAKWIEQNAFNGTLKRIAVTIHSQNPVGRQRMMAAIQNANRFWDEQENSTPESNQVAPS